MQSFDVHFAEKLPPAEEGYTNFVATPESFDTPPPYDAGADGYPEKGGNIALQAVASNPMNQFGPVPPPPPPGPQNVAVVIDPRTGPLPENAPESYLCFATCVRYSLCVFLGKYAMNYSRKYRNIRPSVIYINSDI